MATGFILVLVSGFIHSLWNLFAKGSIDKSVFLWYCQWPAIVIFIPGVVWESPSLSDIPWEGWLLILCSMLTHGVYVLLLAKTYTVGDLSQAYPIMRGVGPLFVPILGVAFLQENLSWTGWLGISLILTGIASVSRIGNMPRLTGYWNPTLLLALGVGLMITAYTVIDKLALQYVPPFTLNEATNIGNLIALSWIAWKSKGLRREWSVNWKTILLGGVLAPGGYILFLFALESMPVAQLAPMREVGTVFATLLGIFILKEPQGKARLIGSVLITAGIILLAQ